MAQSHTLRRHLPFDTNCGEKEYPHQASWSLNPDGTLVLFVHGFRGHPTNTWKDFEFIAPSRPGFRRCDFMFFHFNSFCPSITLLSAQLFHLLEKLEHGAGPMVDATLTPGEADLRRGQDFRYNKIRIVAHSLGAVLAREALLIALNPNYGNSPAAWVDKVRLILFAPAHKGSRLPSMLYNSLWASLKPIGPLLAAGLHQTYPILNELDHQSTYMTSLSSDLKQALRRRPRPGCLVAEQVVVGRSDRVVVHGQFGNDPLIRQVSKKNHQNICRPILTSYELPVDIVENSL